MNKILHHMKNFLSSKPNLDYCKDEKGNNYFEAGYVAACQKAKEELEFIFTHPKDFEKMFQLFYPEYKENSHE